MGLAVHDLIFPIHGCRGTDLLDGRSFAKDGLLDMVDAPCLVLPAVLQPLNYPRAAHDANQPP